MATANHGPPSRSYSHSSQLTRSLVLVFQGLFQRVDLHYSASFYRDDIFRSGGDRDDLDFGDDELVINVRAGEIVGGVPWYPLVPVEFYRTLVAETRKTPVFLGQLDDSAYVSDIRRAFPGARMIPSGGPMVDLARLRRAGHLCLAVSTFSWVAGFLSDAVTVHYPLLGFMHPRCFVPGAHDLGGIDLLPADDPRFCFHLFPALRGDRYDRYAAHVGRFSPISRRISRRHAALLKGAAPFAGRHEQRYAVDASWYLRTYPDAAWDIAEGWYADAAHHYVAAGRAQGYAPHEPLYRSTCPDIARGKYATQSSVSPWSAGRTVEEDAARVVDGDPDKELGCHTTFENGPWWMVDLGGLAEVECVTIFNRHTWDFMRARTVPFILEFSSDRKVWKIVGGAPEPFDFGADGAPSVPWQWVGTSKLAARYVRVRLRKSNEALHITAVEVKGRLLSDIGTTEPDACGAGFVVSESCPDGGFYSARATGK